VDNAIGESKKGIALKNFVDLIRRYQEMIQAPEAKWSEVIKALTEELQYFKELDKTSQTPEEAVNGGENVREWINALATYQQSGEGDLQNFIDSLTLGNDDKNDKDEEKNYGVKLMTLHGAKGLEFPHVYLVGLEDGLLPHANSKLEGNVDEERRLLYVGITRAMKTLVISHCVKRKKYGQDEFCKPSPFLNDFDEALIEKIHTGSASVHTINTMETDENPLSRLKARLAAGNT
jgi:superfamily I DNA/RNA helicase